MAGGRRLRAQRKGWATRESFTEEVAPGWTQKDEQEFSREGGGNLRRTMLESQVVWGGTRV